MNEILWCDHSNETSSAVRGIICSFVFQYIIKLNVGNSLDFYVGPVGVDG